MNNRETTKYVAIQKPRPERTFWQRTLLVFGLALITVIIAFGFLYSRSLSLMGQNQVTGTTREADSSNEAQVLTTDVTTGTAQTDTVQTDNADSERAVEDRGSWLFFNSSPSQTTSSAPEERAGEPAGEEQANPPAPAQQLVPTAGLSDSNAENEVPELLRDLRLSEQALDEDEPRVAVELLLPLTQAHPAFRPAEVAQQLYLAYLAMGDQAMRREARSEAIGYYDQAGQQRVADQTGLTLRRAAIERYFPVAQAQSTTAAETAASTATGVTPENVGQIAVAVPTATPVAPVQIQVAPAPSCPDDRIALSAPTVNAIVQGSVAIVGSVTLEEEWYYKLEWAPADSEEYAYFGGNSRSVASGTLGRLDTRNLPNGETTVRVTVVDATGNYPPPCEVDIVVAN